MSYVVLARKWRPMKFEDVASQDHVTTTLKNAIQSDRLASAYLFSGPRGVGKTTTARILAKAINCDEGPTPSPCNECSSCQEITTSRSLDVFEVDGASNRGIDEVRNLRENLKYAPSKGKHKIYIIDEVHMLTTEAFNALLKTLEEPPPRVLFIFATTEFHKVPPTILSRCQRYDFRRITMQEIVRNLESICNKEGIKIAEPALFLLAKKADGSLRDSQSLLDQVISFCGQEINLDDITELLGVIGQDFFFDCTDVIAARDVSAALQLVETIFNHGYDMAEFLNGLAEHFRNFLVINVTTSGELLEGMDTYLSRYQENAQAFTDTDLLRLVKMATDASYQIKRASNPKIVLEMTLLKMIKMDKSVELTGLLTDLKNLKTKTNSPPDASTNPASEMKPSTSSRPTTNESAHAGTTTIKQIGNQITTNGGHLEPAPINIISEQKDPAIPDEKAIVSLEKIKTEWPKIVDCVKNKKIHLGSFLNEGYPTAVTDGTLEVSFGQGGSFHLKTVEQNRKVVEEVIHENTGFKLRLSCRQDDSDEFHEVLQQLRQDAPMPEEDTPDQDDALQIPIVRKVVEMFDGEIVGS